MTKNYDCEVLITGGGPVGAALAIELGLFGISCIVIERHKTPQRLPKAIGISPRSVEFFQRWSIADKLHQAALLSESIPNTIAWCSGLKGKLYALLNIGDDNIEAISPFPYARIPLWQTEGVLRQRIEEFSTIDYRLGFTVIHVEQNSTGVTALIQETVGEKQFNLRAKYLIACDGANSHIRDSIGISMQGSAAISRMRQVLFCSPDLSEKIILPVAIAYFVIDQERFVFIRRVDDKENLWDAQIPIFNEGVEVEDVDVNALLNKVAGLEFKSTIESTALWTMQGRVANCFREKRIFLAGDSAHALPPAGGHGLNTGFGDAVNLGWKLAAVLQGWGKDSLLDTYDMERRAVALRNLNAAMSNITQRKILIEHPPQKDMEGFQAALFRNAKSYTQSLGIDMGYRYTNTPLRIEDNCSVEPTDQRDRYIPSSYPGHIAPHAVLINGQTIYEILGTGFTLLVFNSKDTHVFEESARKQCVPLKIVRLNEPTIRDLYASDFILIRPDRHIVWRKEKLPQIFFYEE